MTAWVSVLESATTWLTETAWDASLLIGAVWLSQAVLRRRLAARWRYALWMVVALRLCLPALPGLPWGNHGLVSLEGLLEQLPRASERAKAAGPLLSHEADGTSPWRLTTGELPLFPEKEARSDGGASSWRLWLAAVWIGGLCFLSSRLLVSTWIARRRVRRLEPVVDIPTTRLLESCAREIGVGARPSLHCGPTISAPLLFGCVRPRILLPEDFRTRWTGNDLRNVFLHELAHVRGRDVIGNCVLSWIEVVHWMNPLVWWAFARCREERELACDEWVLSCRGEGAAVDYGHTLLRLLDRLSGE